jgi:hypothetical protein
MIFVRIALFSAAVAFAAVIVWASLGASISESFGRIVADPWGLVTILDVYLGFVLASVVIVAFERNTALRVFLVVALWALGNVVTLAWLAWRLPALTRRLNREA